MHAPIVMPLPPFSRVTSNTLRHAGSISSSRDGELGIYGRPLETESVLLFFFSFLSLKNFFFFNSETMPLLSRPVTPSKHYKPKSYLQPSTHPHSHNIVSVSPPPVSQSTTSNGHANNTWHPHHGSHPRLHSLGWIEYHLPDGTVYYVHPTSRVTTEINLRSERMLTSVEKFLADHDKDPAVAGVNVEVGEIWLRDVGSTKKGGMVLEKWWVDHMVRTVVILGDERRKGSSVKGKAKKAGVVFVEEDRGFFLAVYFFGMVLIVFFFFGIFRT